MKYKVILFAILSIFFPTLRSQTVQTSTVQLNWKGVEKWIANSSSVRVISFDGAKYPTETRLPYFHQRITADFASVYAVEIKNPVYISLTNDENDLLVSNNHSIPSEVEIQYNILQERETSYLDINILPFVTDKGKILKLKSFDLQLTQTSGSKKVSTVPIHTYAQSSVLAQGKFVKIHIPTSGVYKLTYEDLVNMGIDAPNVRIFGYGGAVLDQNFMLPKIDDLPEVAIWMEKGTDDVFNAGDYILFYAQDANHWAFDNSKSMFTHTVNTYSKYGYYFVTSDAGTGKKITDESNNIPASATINDVQEFTDYQLHEKDLFSITQSGKEFYGETFNDVISYDFPFTFPNSVITNSTIVRLDVAASASVNANFTLSLNGGQSKTLSVAKKTDGDNFEQARASSGIFTFMPQGDTFNFNVSYSKSVSTAVGYLNYIEINVRRQLKMNGSMLQFQNVDYLGQNTYNRYQLSNANGNVKIWDITDPQNISNMVTDNVGGKLSFATSGNTVSTYIAIDPKVAAAFPKPVIDGVIPNQNLHGLTQADMVIITNPNFVAQAETLAQAHREKDNLTVSVVTTDQVYNEFSSGTPDATAYRWTMKMLYDRALASNNTNDLPKYLLIFGRGSYDNRKLRTDSGDALTLTYQAENSLVLTLSYITDDYFGLLNDNEGSQVPSNLMDIGVGRFPAKTVQEATDVVNKTIGYMNNQGKGSWKNQLCFLADDGDAALHMKQADSVAVSVARNFPAYQVNKIYLDAYLQEVTASGESYPLAKSRFQNLLRSGLFLLNYTGHANPSGWTNENIFSVADVRSLSNLHLPIIVGATCDFLQFDGEIVSGGEHVILNPVGGGIGILSAARPVYASQNLTINKLFCDNLFKKKNGQNQRIGDVLAYAKNNVGTEINKLSYIFMGDPALKLTYPTKYQILTTKVNESTPVGKDTLRALSTATIQGFIADENGTKITSFNGTLHAIVLDKIQRITTLNNDGDGGITYSDRPNTLFSGDAAVTNGAFSFSFMLPKDIKYNYGTGRIDYYAQENTDGSEAQGYFENFIIGGTNKDNIVDTEGPVVQLFLNSTNFVPKDKVNETPLFIANVNDQHGINTIGSGIGHDVMLTIDEDPNQSYILNDYFQATANSYTDGVVKFKLTELAAGKHTLTFRVWDLLNNSTTQTTEFEVVKGLTPKIFSIYNYPNPVKTQTNIIVNHDRPETILKTTVEIFDLSGRKIWSFTQSSADNISWNLITSDGNKVKTGIYLYKVSIKTSDSDVTSKTNKMLITEQ